MNPGVDRSRADDEAAVRAVEASYDAAWQIADVDGLVGCLTEDAVLVNPRGEMVRGRDEIRRTLGEFLAGPAKGSHHRGRVSRVEFISDDVAIADGTATIEMLEQPEGGTSQPLVHGFTDVLVKEDGVWAIAHVRAYAWLGTETGMT